jgi:gamma-polyglutamate biosynthesis protein CapA
VLCNLECVLSDVGWRRHSLRSLHMRGHPKTAEFLARWGITTAHVANNHILEHGLEAATDTVRRLERVGIRPVGGGRNGDFQGGIVAERIDLGAGGSLAVVAACILNERYAPMADPNDILHCVRAHAAKGHLVLVSLHWGEEFMDRPSLRQRALAKALLDAGALLVVGHHPHVVQGVSSGDGGLVAYSLGDFIFDGEYEETMWSIILSLQVAAGRVVAWECVPLVKGEDFRPRFATSSRKTQLVAEIARRHELATRDVADPECYCREYEKEAAHLQADSRHALWASIARSFLRYRPIYWPQLAWRPIQRRLGWW